MFYTSTPKVRLYERNYYTLTWNTGENASYIAPEQVRYGAAVTKPDKNPTKVGYEFKGPSLGFSTLFFES